MTNDHMLTVPVLDAGVTAQMLTSGHVTQDKGQDGIPFQTVGHQVITWWHPGPDTRVTMSGLIAADIRRRIELGHGSWDDLLPVYGIDTPVSTHVFPYCQATDRMRIVCNEFASPLLLSISEGQFTISRIIIDVISEKLWVSDWFAMYGHDIRFEWSDKAEMCFGTLRKAVFLVLQDEDKQ